MSADGGPIILPTKRRKIRAADLFCGAGGTSTGAERAVSELGMELDLVAVNHWETAIATHTRNHPKARHMCADLEHVRPRQAVPGGVLDILMASPTCTYYSRARGGRPVHDQQRMDPWHVVRWCTDLRVHRLLVENVAEMMDWGPCDIRTGRPIASRKGEYFRAWLSALKAVFKRVDYRVINCADHGDPTTRERLFIIASNVGRLRWPEPTHAKGGATDLLGMREPWRSAKEDVIDWTIQGKSIFNRKRPLKPNTIRRILAGAKRYGWPAPHVAALQALLDGKEPVLDVPASEASPFLLHFCGTSGGALDRAGLNVDSPVPTLTAGGGHVGLVMATGAGGAARLVDDPIPSTTTTAAPHFIEPLLMGTSSGQAAKPTTEPAPTITTGGASAAERPGNARPQLVEPIIVSKHGGPGNTARGADEPLYAVDTGGAGSVAQPLLAPYYGGGSGLTSQATSEPVPAITTKARFGVADPIITSTRQSKENGGPRARSIDSPLPTVVASDSRFGLAEPMLLRTSHGDSDGRDPGGRVLNSGDPLPAQTGSNEFGVAEPVILPTTHQGDARVRSSNDPLPTVTGANRGELGISTPLVVQTSYSGERVPTSADAPLRTITSAKGGDMAVADAIVMRGNVGEGRERDMRPATQPLQTVTCSESLAMSAPFLVPNFGERPGQEPRTHDVDAPLPAVTATGHLQLAAPVFDPESQTYRIDILYRMLHWRELARAMSFDDEGKVYDFAGTATEITKQIGNAVPGRTAKALVRALLEG